MPSDSQPEVQPSTITSTAQPHHVHSVCHLVATRLLTQADMDAVLEVLVLLPVVRLIVFAGGPDKPGLEHLSERLKLTESVRRTSYIDRFEAFMRGVDFC